MNTLKVKRLTDTATLPTYGSKGAACFDLYADTVQQEDWGVLVGTGLAVEIPEGHVMMVYSRSGMGFKHGIVLRNGTGIVDADYRGQIMVALTHNPIVEVDVEINTGDRIAQAMIIPVQQFQFTEVSELSETERGEGGFGSSGK